MTDSGVGPEMDTVLVGPVVWGLVSTKMRVAEAAWSCLRFSALLPMRLPTACSGISTVPVCAPLIPPRSAGA